MPGIPADGFSAAEWPDGFRAYQLDALTGIEKIFAGGRSRCWAVLPPGAGKTLVGLESARRLGGTVVVFVPNTAIQGQWVRTWERFVPGHMSVGIERDLRNPVTVLTYQSLAVFDDDSSGSGNSNGSGNGGGSQGTKSTGPLLDKLHDNGRALVAALRAAGPLTIVLDECHHLLEVWGRLVAELLDELGDARVLGLTATPPETLTSAQMQLVEQLFGTALRGASLPAVVKSGFLAPFAELAYLTAPTPVEADYIKGQAERFAEFRTGLMDPAFATTGFLTWCDVRFVVRSTATGADPAGGTAESTTLPWGQLERQDPDLTRAALRLHHAGLLSLPPGARIREEHRMPPTAEDWVALLEDYVRGCLAGSADPRDAAAVAAVRAALPSIGYRLTSRGVQAAPSPVDRVLARSAAKTDGAVEIVAAEGTDLGASLRALVLCDFEQAAATVSASLTDVLQPQAGGALLALRGLVADERTAALEPMLVTGRTVAAAPDDAAAFAAWARTERPGLELEVEVRDGLGYLRGAWDSRTWVALVTRYFETGRARVLVGTRALLGEGWDARGVNVAVDLTSATTTGSVVQMRGRGLRLDPAWPEKVTNNWTVVCVTDDHPKGAADWRRFVRKHEGYLAVTAAGDVVSGIGHVDPSYSPHLPPGPEKLAESNVAMLLRAQLRERTREQWAVGEPYTDELVHTIRVTAGRTGGARLAPADSGELCLRTLPDRTGVTVTAGRRLLWFTPRRAARLLAEAAGDPPIDALAYVVADTLRACGLSTVGAEAVAAFAEADGIYRFQLGGVPHEVSLKFAQALDELIGSIGEPRWLMPRFHLAALPTERRARRAVARDWLRGRAPGNAVVYHAVPAVFARSGRTLTAFTAAWNRYVSAGQPLASASPEGEGVMVTHRGSSPLDVTTALRVAWT